MVYTSLSPGFISGIFFIFLDVIALALIEYLLIPLVSAAYYTRVYSGKPIAVRSIEIPGVLSNVVGDRFCSINLAALLVKLLSITVIFFINLDINSRSLPVVVEQLGTFDFNASDAEWLQASAKQRNVKHSEHLAMMCSEQVDESVTFYRLAFNLENGVILLNDTDPANGRTKYGIVDPICLRPGVVAKPQPLIRIAGCSHLGAQHCNAQEGYIRTRRLRLDYRGGFPQASDEGLGPVGFGFYVFNQTDVDAFFAPEYSNVRLRCMRQCVGLGTHCCDDTDKKPCRKDFHVCIVLARNETHTVFERWDISNFGEEGENRKVTLKRPFPGPVFEGDFDLGDIRLGSSGTGFTHTAQWYDIGSTFVRENMVYRYRPRNVTVEDAEVMTFIPTLSLFLIGAVLFFIILAFVLYFVLFRNDERPRFNTIDGLSSILREELQPTGKSTHRGKTTVLWTDGEATLSNWKGMYKIRPRKFIDDDCNKEQRQFQH